MSIKNIPNIQLIEVRLSDVKVGRIALTPDNICAFEYDVDYLRTGISISPFYLPLQAGVFVSKRDPFAGNFGVFNDSLPDGWGNLLLDRYLTEQGINPHRLNTLERLSLIGKRGVEDWSIIPKIVFFYPMKSFNSIKWQKKLQNYCSLIILVVP